MQTRTRILAGVAALALAAALAAAFAPRPMAVEVAKAVTGDFERHIEEDARTRVVERYVLSAPLAARLLRPRLREGDAVRAGEVVAVLAPVLPGLPDARTQAAQVARVQAAESALQGALAGAAAARVGQAQARAAVARDEALVPQGFVSPARVEDERWSLAAADQSLAAAEASVQVARHERDTARAALLAVQSPGAAPFELRAPVSGRVLRLNVASEAPVALGAPLLELGDTARLEVVAELLTADALQVRPGAPVRIERWGGDQPLAGRVQRVEPGGFTKVSALGVEEQRTRVLVDLVDPPAARAGLGDGFRVTVAVRVQAQAGALKVPVSAVFPRPGAAAGEMAVFRVEDGRARQVAVRLGGRNGQEAWIREGLAEGDTVIVYPARTLSDGLRVKAGPA